MKDLARLEEEDHIETEVTTEIEDMTKIDAMIAMTGTIATDGMMNTRETGDGAGAEAENATATKSGDGVVSCDETISLYYYAYNRSFSAGGLVV